MDPLGALGAAAAVIQFVDFGTRLLTSTWDTYRDASGQGQDLRDFRIVSKDLDKWISPVRRTLESPRFGIDQRIDLAESKQLESELRKLCSTCDDIAKNLEKVLPKTLRTISQAESQSQRATSIGARFMMALEQYLNHDEIAKLEKRLVDVRTGVVGVLLTSVWYATCLVSVQFARTQLIIVGLQLAICHRTSRHIVWSKMR